jgi:hypothetical protein
MTDPTLDDGSGERSHHGVKSRRIRFPKIDFVTLIFAILAAVILLFLTAEMWLPLMGE